MALDFYSVENSITQLNQKVSNMGDTNLQVIKALKLRLTKLEAIFEQKNDYYDRIDNGDAKVLEIVKDRLDQVQQQGLTEMQKQENMLHEVKFIVDRNNRMYESMKCDVIRHE